MEKNNSPLPIVNIEYIQQDFDIQMLDHPSWQAANAYITQHDWLGNLAPATQHFETRFLWSNNSLYVRFESNIDSEQPLTVNETPQLRHKTMKLWERDVCELFLAPDKNNGSDYFEFEVAPTGEWLDLNISHQTNNGERERVTDWDFQSNMQTAASIQKHAVITAFKVDWKALQIAPKKGDGFLGNFFRALGKEPNRAYLAWSPTKTHEPNFHVPEVFGKLVLV